MITAVAIQAVPIITLFRRIQDAITATRLRAVGAAMSIRQNRIPLPIIALLARIDFAVATQ
jgi:hypothetical protein